MEYSRWLNKLALGSAQFGMNYGISNTQGQVSLEEVNSILLFANENGITTIDTAQVYGNSERILGQALQLLPDSQFEIISKYPKGLNAGQLEIIFRESISHLQLDSLYGYLAHDFFSLQDKSLQEKLEDLKQRNLINNLGVSVYYPQQAEWILQHGPKIDIMQIPFNVYDQRFNYLLPELKQQGIHIHARSVFLQGLFFLNPNCIAECFISIKHSLQTLQRFAKENAIPLSALLMNYVIQNPFIDKVIIGIQSVQQLQNNLQAYDYIDESINATIFLQAYQNNDENIILPFNWSER